MTDTTPPADRAGLRDRIAETLATADGWKWAPGFKALSPTWQGYQSRADAVLAVLPASADRAAVVAAAPVKQRADCTELEWAEQERARFERLYTRETVRADLAEQRADTAARDADIYQRRLERLGEGYTRERKRAEKAEADANHNADLVAAAVQRAEQAETETERLRTGRVAVLRDAAEYLVRDLYPAVYVDAGQKTARGVNRSAQGLLDLADAAELRRVADETPRPETQALFCVCGAPAQRDGDRWTHQPGTGDTCLYRPDARPRCPDCRVPHDLTPGGMAMRACASILASIADRDAAAGPAVGAQQPKEAEHPRTVCVCGHTRGEHLVIGGRLLCDVCDGLAADACKEFEAL